MSRHRVARVPLVERLRSALARPRRAAAGLSVAVLACALLLTPATSGAYTASILNSNNAVTSAAAFFTCDSAWFADRASAYYSYTLTQPTGSTTAPDTSGNGTGNGNGNGFGNRDGFYRGTMLTSSATPKACPRDPGGSWVLDGSTSHLVTPLPLNNPTTFSTEIWFKTKVAGGKLFSFNGSRDSTGGQYDRHTYINTAGHLVFGTYNGVVQTITSPGSVTDDTWHHVVSTLSPTGGMALWLDGVQVASNSTFRTPETFTGYWKIGYDTLGGSWPGVGSAYFTGSLRYAAVYTTVLTSTQIQNHYNAGR